MANSPYGDLSGFKSYGDWQAANKAAGGSGNNQDIANYFNGGGQAQQSIPTPARQMQPTAGPRNGGSPGNTGVAGGGGSQPFDYNTPGSFQAWYNQQQGGNRPEDMARFGWTGNEEGSGNQSADTFKRWDPYLIKEGPDAGKYKSMRGAPGVFDKPTECPPGMMPGGPDETSGCVPNGSAGGGGGGGGNRGGGGGGYAGGGGQADNPIYKYLAGRYMNAAQDPEAAFNQFANLGGANTFQSQMDAARKQVDALPPGPARDAALSRLSEQQLTLKGQMGQAANADAQARLSSLLGGEQYWGGQLPLSYNQLAEQGREADQSNALGYYNANINQQLGMGQLGLGQQQLDWTKQWDPYQLNATQGFQASQNQLYNMTAQQQYDLQQKQLDLQKKQQGSSKGKLIGGALGGIVGSIVPGVGTVLGAGAGSAIGGALSDIRMKENIEELTPLTRISKIPVYTYNYTFEPERRRIGVMAQDVEKVAPELVHTGWDGLKRVDTYGLTALTLAAVKELSNGSN